MLEINWMVRRSRLPTRSEENQPRDFGGHCLPCVARIRGLLIPMSDANEFRDEVFTEEHIGLNVITLIDGVAVRDVVEKKMLPNGVYIIGPRLTLGHIFARWTMLPSMDEVSEATEKLFKELREMD